MRKFWIMGLSACLAGAIMLALPRSADAIHAQEPARPFDGTLSVLTYNIKGLPWPIARGRPEALARIADRLRLMRGDAREPQVVLLQEAFTAEAQSIGRIAGYPYSAAGPSAGESGSAAMTGADRSFAAGAHWWKGETEGKFVGSGLEILSDYPIVAVHRMAFPSFACAGYDCLANKGALLVSVAIPGIDTPVDILTTHLNSRHASGVEDERSNFAYRRQVSMLTAFVRAVHDPDRPLIAAGDFNVGQVAPRQAALLGQVRERWVPDAAVLDALTQYRRQGGVLSRDAAWSLGRARDWQFYSNGAATRLTLAGIDVPFGHEPTGTMLSDHVGYVARFRVEGAQAPRMATAGRAPLTSSARSTA